MTGIDVYGQISHPMHVTDALMLLIRWCCWCANAADALLLMLLMRWCCWWADTADELILLMVTDVLMQLMWWCCWCVVAMMLLKSWCCCCYDAADTDWSGAGLALTWHRIGSDLASDWYWIDIWLGVAWHWIGSGLTPDWHPIDRLDRHQSGTGFDKYPLVRPGCPDVPFPGMEYKTDVDKTVGHGKWPVSSFGKLVSHWVIWVNFEIVSHLSLVWNSHKKRTKSPTPYLTPRFALFVGSENEYMYIWVHTMWASSPM